MWSMVIAGIINKFSSERVGKIVVVRRGVL
jgi:hypothetical protein